ncbi:YciI family protein [Shimazuella soli]|uniref:YciI family protein n=1 Tax=Shimazuella soli TaxID=1892854 RepID=UPI001F10FB78|nr:YciI family protein [Shimazuella soli]
MLIVKASKYTEAGVRYSQEDQEAKTVYKRNLVKANVLLTTESLQPSATGMKVLYSSHRDEPKVQVGPFSLDDTAWMTEYILIDVETEEEALKWALQMPVPKNRGKFEIELQRLEENLDVLEGTREHPMEHDLKDLLSMLKITGGADKYESRNNSVYRSNRTRMAKRNL